VSGVPFIATNVLMFFFILVVLFKVQWALALIILIPVPFVILGSRYLWKQMSRLYRRWVARARRLFDATLRVVTRHSRLQGLRSGRP